ncbi:MAG: SRPBCC family protein [Actinomycetota bacterium]
MKIEVFETIDRPVSTVFDWYARDHVRNHPRWDPDMHLEKVTDGPIGIGTVIRRRNTHFETPIEGTMEVIEFEPEEAFGVVIRDGPQETRGRVTFRSEDGEQTRIGISAEFEGMDESQKPHITTLMQRSASNIKQLIESDL